MSIPKEPEVIIKEIPVRDNWWNKNQVVGTRRVSSGPLPTFDELTPLDGTGEETIVEGSEVEERRSSTFPGKRRQLPFSQKGVDLVK